MTRKLLEISANSLASALAAQAGGADRVELCENLRDGGTTPSYGTIAVARDRLRIPLYVLIRPRGGDFLYDENDLAAMRADVETCVRLGCDGVVIGALDADGAVDAGVCAELIAAAGALGVTFHRAFDAARDHGAALEAVIALGCERILTSGGAADAGQGADRIAALVAQAAGRIALMAGAGVTAHNIAALAQRAQVGELHASAKAPRLSAMRYRNDNLAGLSPDWVQSDADIVRALAQALNA
ncbi:MULTISPECIES: copper homeostasis protein CutC [unclassified Lysobacter]|uniref:copper homeostasis protein CutC n=1 Tax=unclassified Lysobacter TaxID=2635362 RepID=UPI001BEBB730|nr:MULTISPECIES: copper homeostasis protein CutC [unclassified Lysobacter]MBT2745331.1 copper homeostasis protein CutC [Lysobacter sp. ISL-42]MBT2751928.1 copper homeostasis protein CutC [Lysobacter sp. ISL-50]MBT2777893.1 copper homeostasis protein CutC [Lysobacter sp. ISL-54]MBT2783149.1 copper homeostasis protein CutC [Lysobacter sp. ISL-52]